MTPSALVRATAGLVLSVALLLLPSCRGSLPSSRLPQWIDPHVHLFQSAPPIYEMLKRRNLQVMTICVVWDYPGYPGFEEAEPWHRRAIDFVRQAEGRAAWCSTFKPNDWESEGFARRAIVQLEESFRNGAVGVKFNKDVGMKLKSKDGTFLMPDDPVFDSLWELLVARNKTLFTHLADTSAAWKPLDPSNFEYGYLQKNADEHMYLVPGCPSKEALLAARDRMLARHPKLRHVGAHLGSMEESVDDIARRLDLHPNFAVDTAARVHYLIIQPREKVRQFLLRYQDRVLYATDACIFPGDDVAKQVKSMEEQYDRDWKYFATAETVSYRNHQVHGLDLPEPVLRKLFRDNALRWIPGLVELSTH